MTVLSAPRCIAFLDDLKIPYVVRANQAPDADGIVGVRAENGRYLAWPREPAGSAGGLYRLGEFFVSASLIADAAAATRQLGGDWRPHMAINDGNGAPVAALWRDGRGNVFLPFDPDAAIARLTSEAYRASTTGRTARAARRAAIRTYYGVRPLLPRKAQITMRRAFARIQRRSAFPRWPSETSLHDLGDFLLGLLADVARAPVPYIRPWPRGYAWTVVLTHDVETQTGHDNIGCLRDIEESKGLRSSWNFVPKRYSVDDRLIDDLWRRGFEVGVHGLYHDGRDLESKTMLETRLPEIRRAAGRWRSVGFRSPATERSWDLMPLLPFDYDSSYPDTDPFEPQSGGCCRWLPFFNGDLVELPITLVQDHTMFVILGKRDEQLWSRKAHLLRERGGMALLITHPDYMLDGDRLAVYARFLSELANDDSAWHALPHEVSAWWRRRAASSVVNADGRWRVEGPAESEAEVAFATSAQAAYR